MTNFDAVYSRFEALEEQVAQYYFQLHEQFITNPPLARFWAETALEELHHASILRYCRAHQLFGDDIPATGVADRIGESLETVKGIVSDPRVTTDDAFFAALLVESSGLDDVYERLIRPLATDRPLLHEAIVVNLRMHHDRFATGAAEFVSDRGYVEAFKVFARGVRPFSGEAFA